VLAGCGREREPPASASAVAERTALRSYLRQIEPLRLGVNRLLEDADPILAGYERHRLTRREAARRMDLLERHFAGYTLRVAAIEPATRRLARAHRLYAHTYVLEDAYLSALAAALAEGEFDHLPDTQSQQRAAIVEWRTELELAAVRAGIRLPADLQVAGRGEIAPLPEGS
jgi:hypothetical protein